MLLFLLGHILVLLAHLLTFEVRLQTCQSTALCLSQDNQEKFSYLLDWQVNHKHQEYIAKFCDMWYKRDYDRFHPYLQDLHRTPLPDLAHHLSRQEFSYHYHLHHQYRLLSRPLLKLLDHHLFHHRHRVLSRHLQHRYHHPHHHQLALRVMQSFHHQSWLKGINNSFYNMSSKRFSLIIICC